MPLQQATSRHTGNIFTADALFAAVGEVVGWIMPMEARAVEKVIWGKEWLWVLSGKGGMAAGHSGGQGVDNGAGVARMNPLYFVYENRSMRETSRALNEPRPFADCLSDDNGCAGDDESQRGRCSICLTSRACVVFKLCRHLATCMSCLMGMIGANATRCPMCNMSFETTEEVYTT